MTASILLGTHTFAAAGPGGSAAEKGTLIFSVSC
jgi:hypothetical protein